MKFILGTKKEMTQLFDENGSVVPVTSVFAGPITVTQVKSMEKDGYKAVQFGFGVRNIKNVNKAQQGAWGETGPFSCVREFRTNEDGVKPGDTIDVSVFSEGDIVEVSGVSKGKGFQGVVKRHGFHGGPRSHGQKHSEREPGSIGATGPQRVFKGTKMGGRMGNDTVTVKGLRVVAVDTENNVLFVSGAVPGRRGTLLTVCGETPHNA